MIIKQEILRKSNLLSINSQKELYNFLKSEKIACMENTNGVFFDLSAITDEMALLIDNKLDILQQFEYYTDSNLFLAKPEGMEEIEKIDSSENNNDYLKETSDLSFKQEKLFSNIEINHGSKTPKKNNHLKYSVAKKKYNKQIFTENKKFEDYDLNKLEIEEYTL